MSPFVESCTMASRYRGSDDVSQSWGGEVAMSATKDHIYEYACHEGNYALPGIFAGAREAGKVAAPKAAE